MEILRMSLRDGYPGSLRIRTFTSKEVLLKMVIVLLFIHVHYECYPQIDNNQWHLNGHRKTLQAIIQSQLKIMWGLMEYKACASSGTGKVKVKLLPI